jgi:hypothetical protein
MAGEHVMSISQPSSKINDFALAGTPDMSNMRRGIPAGPDTLDSQRRAIDRR